ncbi:bifunctional enoyl-CoA hydratase/phosphate acetyltransferase [Aliishimia ponticola]|uniref:Bifunctional enoyl-CoA hydratase/phosphate acetyltransferase n=1 Tax=Aliishimia ponticola TaxID=2499833 RepID=A0A4S4NDB2_9RHOB|nr:bifunctional enoyl-CoA hydratase/phosphate acetyltransferase [Aliishimia ponticola]THH37429.1 bifunctional enoyl-CoA hydratase/phosphate acetyltransferase [Aliishimia ponticola]
MITENKTYDELAIGETATVTRVCTARDLYIYAHASGNLNPLHLPNDTHDDLEAVAPSMWVGGLISAVIGNVLPGPGTLYLSQNLKFAERVHVGDTLSITVTVAEKRPDNIVVLDTRVTGPDDRPVAEGQAEILAPRTKVHLEGQHIPNLLVESHVHFEKLLERARPLPPIRTAVVAPEEPAALGGALLAARQSIITPILIGARDKILAVAQAEGDDLTGVEIIDEPDHREAAKRAVALARDGEVGAIMKGHLHTSDLLSAILSKSTGIRTTRRLSHVFVMDVPGLDHLLLVSDAAVNIMPDLQTKVDITQSAIDVGLAIGLELPKVGILSAIETVNPAIPSTLDAAALSKMAERGQIKGGIVDGPLAMDNAMDVNAARTKGIISRVAGHSEILIAPNMEAGNMLAKQLTFVAHAEAAGIALGAQVPVILTSRADGEMARLASCAIAALYQEWRARNAQAHG